jgi:hypothetical protein
MAAVRIRLHGGMSALLPESMLALRWPAGVNATALAAEAPALAAGVNATALAAEAPALAAEAPALAPTDAAALVHAAALALILAALLVLLALEARDWLLRKRALALEQAFTC